MRKCTIDTRDASFLFKAVTGMLIPLKMNDIVLSDPVIRIIMLQCRLITKAQEANKSHSMGHKCRGILVVKEAIPKINFLIGALHAEWNCRNCRS